MGPMKDDAPGLMHFPAGGPCKSCAIRPGTDANLSPETMATLKECIASGEPFYCHESVAVRDEDGHALDRHGNRYRRLPQSRWRLCRGWTRAIAAADQRLDQQEDAS
jgi:hypothetical protein